MKVVSLRSYCEHLASEVVLVTCLDNGKATLREILQAFAMSEGKTVGGERAMKCLVPWGGEWALAVGAGKSWNIFMQDPRKYESMLVHELKHCIDGICTYMGIPLASEASCYLMEAFHRELWVKIRKAGKR